MASRGRRGGEDELMAVVIAKYTRDRAEAKRLIWLMQNRCNKEHEKITTTLFDWNAATERKYAYQMINEAGKGSYFYRFVINPDPEKEDKNHDLYLRELTEHTLLGVDKQVGQPVPWVAAEHGEHVEKRHVIVIAILKRRLNRENLVSITKTATEDAAFQRRSQDAFYTAIEKRKDWPATLPKIKNKIKEAKREWQ
jgi:hypothetical protein